MKWWGTADAPEKSKSNILVSQDIKVVKLIVNGKRTICKVCEHVIRFVRTSV